MHGRRSHYKGGLSDTSKWINKNDKGKRISDDMYMKNKDKMSKPHSETYNQYDTLSNENSSSGEPCTPKERMNPFYKLDP